MVILVIIAAVLSAIVLAAIGAYMYISFNSDIACLWLQRKYFKGHPVNSYESLEKQVDHVMDSGVRYRNAIQYSTHFPNSFLDLYYATEQMDDQRPTLVFIHGGGWIFGGRVTGDPLTGTTDSMGALAAEIASRGFNVVSIDYCLAPEWRYPKQYEQFNELFAFLIEHREQYQLNMDNVTILGGSAGAVMTAQYGLIVSNSNYAAVMGIKPAISREAIKALVVDGAPMNTSTMDFFARLLFKTWFGKRSLRKCEQSKQVHIATWLDESYPACFVTAGNFMCYQKDAEELVRALEGKGVEHGSYFVDKRDARAMHGYLTHFATDSYAREGLEQIIAFLKSKK